MIPEWIVPLLWWLFGVLAGYAAGYGFRSGFDDVISRAERERVLDLVAPVVVDGACVGCGGRQMAASPPFVAHNPFCPEVDRFNHVRRLLKL